MVSVESRLSAEDAADEPARAHRAGLAAGPGARPQSRRRVVERGKQVGDFCHSGFCGEVRIWKRSEPENDSSLEKKEIDRHGTKRRRDSCGSPDLLGCR